MDGGDRRAGADFCRRQHGLNTLEHQPAKIAAMEGDFETQARARRSSCSAFPTWRKETVDYALEIPKLGSLILVHHFDGVVKGLKDFPKDQRPNAEIIFWSFRIMVAIGFAMLGLGIWGLINAGVVSSTTRAGCIAPPC